MAEPRDQYRELFERSADAILIIEGDTFVDCNDATVRMLRYQTREELLRTHPSELSPPTQPDGRDSFEKANEMIEIAYREGSHRFEWAHVRADGEVFPVEVLLTPVSQGDRQIIHVVWRDITERRLLEEQLRQSQKMDAVGKLAGGIAHDFNNLLVVMLGHADLLRERMRSDHEAREHVDAIQEAGQRAAALVRQLLAFGRKQQRLPEVVDLTALVDRMQRLLERLIGEDLELRTSFAGEPLPVKVDVGQIEQVVMNLVANARDASPRGGTLVIETRAMGRDGDEDEGPDRVALVVSDLGVGMSPETIEHAFDPFFTTKDPGRGTGLGLSTVYAIVQQSGGTIRIESELDRGTSVTVLLPRSDGEPAGALPPTPKPAPAAEGGGERVLVVEDEGAVLDLIERTLRRSGYRVTAVSNGAEGQEAFLADPQAFDLIVSDVITPKLSGPGMVKSLAAHGHRPPVLFISGYTDNALSSLRDMGGDVDFLEKPFSPQVLAARVREALKRRTPGQ